MRKYGSALVLVFALSWIASAQKTKKDKLLPPSESHGMSISGYGCDPQLLKDMPSSSKSLVRLVVWAQYGEKHKRYWQKPYGTYQVGHSSSVSSSGEEEATGAPIAPHEMESYDLSRLEKACNEWKVTVSSTLKTEPNEGKNPKQ